MVNRLKTLLRDELGLPPWIVLATIGLFAFLALNALLRKPVTSAWGLLGPLVIGIALESYEIWAQYRDIGLFGPGNDPLIVILGRHGLDIVSMLGIPVLVVVTGLLVAK